MSYELIEHEITKQQKRNIAFEEYELMSSAIESLDTDDYEYEEDIIEDSEYFITIN